MAEDGFTAAEVRLMKNAWQCMESEPKINYQNLAELLGMSNVKSASNAWAKLKSKLKFAGADGEDTPKSTAKTTTKKRSKATVDDDNEGTPVKKVKKERKTKAKQIKKEVTPEFDEADQELLDSTHDSDEDISEHSA